MTHTVEYNSAAHIVESHLHGETSLGELKQTAREAMLIVKEKNCFHILTDLLDAHLNASASEMYFHPQELAQIITEAGLTVHQLKRAFVVAEASELFKFYENVAVNRGHTAMLFSDIEEARKWLQQKE